MHPALFIHEIVTEIFWHTKDSCRTLANTACVCKIFKEPALDLLWQRLYGLDPLWCLVPERIREASYWDTSPGMRAKSKSAQLRVDEWSPFQYYAKRVREIVFFSAPDSHIVKMMVELASQRLLVLPLLNVLEVERLAPNLLCDIVHLCGGRGVTKLVVTDVPDGYWSTRGYEDGRPLLKAFLCQVSRNMKSHLRVFHFTLRKGHYTDPDIARVASFMLPTLRQCQHLVELWLDYSPIVLPTLSSLPHLNTLVMDIRDAPGALDFPHLSVPPNSFLSLQKLHIHCYTRLKHAVKAFEKARCFARSEIVIDICSEFESITLGVNASYFPKDISLLLDALLDSGYAPVGTGTNVGVSVALHTFRVHSRAQNYGDTTALRFKAAFIPLLSLRALKVVDIELDVPVLVSNTDLYEIARAWPAVESLALGSTFREWEDDSCAAWLQEYNQTADFHGIKQLSSQCQHLIHLDILFHCHMILPLSIPYDYRFAAVTVTPKAGASKSRLESLRVGWSPIDTSTSPEAFSTMLRTVFPRLQTLEYGRQSRNGWKRKLNLEDECVRVWRRVKSCIDMMVKSESGIGANTAQGRKEVTEALSDVD